MKIAVCCPSYKRPKVKTLNYLPFCKVYVDEGEFEAYTKENEGAEIVACPKGVQGNVSRVRNYILNDIFKKGYDVCCIVDDDISYIGYYENKKINKVTTDEFFDFLEKYSIICKDFGFCLWVVNLNSDKQCYREYTPFSTTSCILGPFSCHLSNSEIRYDENLPLKEDYDLCIQHLNKYRGILRVNKYHYVCEQSTITGGCSAYRNVEREKSQLELLIKKWGSKIVKIDKNDRSHNKVKRKVIDYNPIIKCPIMGV